MQLLAPVGRVWETDTFCAVHSSLAPDWYWGSFMIQKEAPAPGSLAQWEREWDAAFPTLRHRSFGISRNDGFAGDESELLAAGYTRFHSLTLVHSLNEIAEIKIPLLELRPLQSDEDWQQWLHLQRIVDTEKYTGGRGDYKSQQIHLYRSLQQHSGEWLGAFYKGLLVGDMGLFPAGDHCRLQLVETDPAWRRRGVCSALTCEALLRARQRGCESLVVVGLAGSPAVSLYQRLGFVLTEHTTEWCLALP